MHIKNYLIYIISEYDGLPFTKKHDIDDLYRVIKERHMREFSHIMQGVQHSDLLPRLRPYQQQAITWMILREKLCDSSRGMFFLFSMRSFLTITKF